MIKFKKYFYITVILTFIFVAANIIYNKYLDSFENFNFAYNYQGGISEDVSNLNKILPSLTKKISIKQFELILSENYVPLNPAISVDSIINYTSGQIRFQFSKDSILQSISIFGYNFPSYDSTQYIGSPSISYLFSNNSKINTLLRFPEFLSLIFIFIFIIIGLISIALYYLKYSINLNLLVISIFSFLFVIISTFFTLFFYFNYSIQIRPEEIIFSHNYVNPQLLFEWILSFSKFRSILFDVSVFSFLFLLYLLYVFYKQINKKILTIEK